MSETLNLSGVHSNGEAKLKIGLRKSAFIISRINNVIEIKDAATQQILWNSNMSGSGSGVFNFKGSYDTFSNLQNAVNIGTIIPVNGDTYIIKTEGGYDANHVTIKANDLVAFSDNRWYIIPNNENSGSNGITREELDNELIKYVKKTEIAGVFTYKGISESFSTLPQSAQVGDVYNIRTAGGKDISGVDIKAGDNVCWNGSGWDNLSGIIDLSNYITRTELTSTLQQYAKTDTVPVITASTTLPEEGTLGKTGDLWVIYTE